jgi:adenylate cyclase
MPQTLESSFQRTLSAEILASEQLRARLLIYVLGALLILFTALLFFLPDLMGVNPPPPWIPAAVGGPFLLYEVIALRVLKEFERRRFEPPAVARAANAIIETSLPTVIMYVVSHYVPAATVFGGWPPLLYFIFIVASTLRLNFALPAFTGIVAGAEYMGAVFLMLPLDAIVVPYAAGESVFLPLVFHAIKAVIMLAAGIVAGLVAVRLRGKFVRAMEEATARERVTSLFGQHVSPTVVERLLDRREQGESELRHVCVMFLDFTNFTAQARVHEPTEVVTFLNDAFAYMIEAVNGHQGIINKFLGDGFLAIFGAPLDDPNATQHAVAAALAILAETDRIRSRDSGWTLHVRIGLHCGHAVTGNVGSPRRKEFTVIGDVVNLASRIEQLNKDVGSRLLVSDAVAACIEPGIPKEDIGEVTMKGYAAPVRIWRLD